MLFHIILYIFAYMFVLVCQLSDACFTVVLQASDS